MVDFILKQDYTFPIWKITLDHDYIGVVSLEDPYRTSYIVTDFTLTNKHFNFRINDADGKHIYKFSVPNPQIPNNIASLAEVGKYKKKFMKSKVLVDLRYYSMNYPPDKPDYRNP